MVTSQTQYSLANARSYFAEHLAVGDYYAESNRVVGEWFGAGAQRLGLGTIVRSEPFLRLCENRHPTLDQSFTQRTNTVRTTADGTAANRRVFYDFTFSPPKSVSIAALVAGDSRILHAHDLAVRSALSEFERYAGVRVRKSGAFAARRTGNLVAALFRHTTSRALDPHLHTHAVVINGSWDPVEQRWKALENRDLLLARKFAENVYYHELLKALVRHGYQIENRLRGDFELQGVSEELCRRFSKRDAQIDAALEALLKQRPELARGNLKALRQRLATSERTRKQPTLDPRELRSLWDAQLDPNDLESLRTLTRRPPLEQPRPTMQEAVAWAEEHVFDRASVVPEHDIWKEALGRARGEDFSPEVLRQFTLERGYVRDPDQPDLVTLPHVLAREEAIIDLASSGRGSFSPLVPHPTALDPRLDQDQSGALQQLMANRDPVLVFRGGAGTGKSFVLRQLVDQLERSGQSVVVLAPQRQQVVEMEQGGFPAPTTVSQFLIRPEIPMRGVLVVDEAGQIGGRQMLALLEAARSAGARVILSGDTRQHGPVEASDALLAIERHAGIEPAELRTIRRQDPDLAASIAEKQFIRGYRAAVEMAAQGDTRGSFDALMELGAIVPCVGGTQADALATEYLRLSQSGASTVVVSQTWSEVHHVNDRIRRALKERGLLGSTETRVPALDRLDLTSAQKRDARYYPTGAVVTFNRKYRRLPSGTVGKVIAFVPDGVLVETDQRVVRVSGKAVEHFTVALPTQIPLAAGDRLQLKANRTLDSGRRVSNGELVTVKAASGRGDILLDDGRILDPSYREFLPGYAVTSYGSQGKTVDHVLLSDSGSRPATSAEQWYVSISRGRRSVRIFTPDPVQLRENVIRSGHRPLAVDLKSARSYPRRQVGRWTVLRDQITRFGSTALQRLQGLRFFRSRHHPSSYAHHPERTRNLGH